MEVVEEQSLVQQLKKALECPCCMEVPLPDTVVVGMCSNGHLTCGMCAVQVLQRGNQCPVCRQPTLKIVRGHHLAVSVIHIMTSFMMYNCKHNSCTEIKSGAEITVHELRCIHKPIECPRNGCQYKAPIYKVMDNDHHACLAIAERRDPDDESWYFSLAANHIYSFDTNEIRISHRFKPVLLKGTFGDMESHAYINIVARNGGVVIYSGWLNKREHVDENISNNLKIEIFAYVTTASGEVGQYASRNPKFEGESVQHDDEGVFIPRHILYNWSEWSCQYRCHECASSGVTRRPHIHFQITFIDGE
jgi:Zinc finger, C3HC4 type (RING finger)